jgi:hypothetical protein
MNIQGTITVLHHCCCVVGPTQGLSRTCTKLGMHKGLPRGGNGMPRSYLEHCLCLFKELLGLLAHCLVIEDPGVPPVWIPPAQLPHLCREPAPTTQHASYPSFTPSSMTEEAFELPHPVSYLTEEASEMSDKSCGLSGPKG